MKKQVCRLMLLILLMGEAVIFGMNASKEVVKKPLSQKEKELQEWAPEWEESWEQAYKRTKNQEKEGKPKEVKSLKMGSEK